MTQTSTGRQCHACVKDRKVCEIGGMFGCLNLCSFFVGCFKVFMFEKILIKSVGRNKAYFLHEEGGVWV